MKRIAKKAARKLGRDLVDEGWSRGLKSTYNGTTTLPAKGAIVLNNVKRSLKESTKKNTTPASSLEEGLEKELAPLHLERASKKPTNLLGSSSAFAIASNNDYVKYTSKLVSENEAEIENEETLFELQATAAIIIIALIVLCYFSNISITQKVLDMVAGIEVSQASLNITNSF